MGRKLVKEGTTRPTVQVAAAVKSRLVDWLVDNDKPDQGSIVGKALEFMLDADPAVQQVILRRVPGNMKSAYANALRRMADELEREAMDQTNPDVKGVQVVNHLTPTTATAERPRESSPKATPSTAPVFRPEKELKPFGRGQN